MKEEQADQEEKEEEEEGGEKAREAEAGEKRMRGREMKDVSSTP